MGSLWVWDVLVLEKEIEMNQGQQLELKVGSCSSKFQPRGRGCVRQQLCLCAEFVAVCPFDSSVNYSSEGARFRILRWT
ncbi:hypothetical protein O6P43_022890 [Quillaja saponaria]|uniref:Uncharacterized protein n=1 Tax=Quillaja saponaria TaxID=32244 RepID=A0AAD7PIS7_QUISA|nr:hypothetical protein O6P43_022890 [Quillaja saponaria]